MSFRAQAIVPCPFGIEMNDGCSDPTLGTNHLGHAEVLVRVVCKPHSIHVDRKEAKHCHHEHPQAGSNVPIIFFMLLNLFQA